MNIENVRHFYAYHFTVNRRIWDKCVMALTDEQFTQELSYSLGSIRNQTAHLLNVDERWFSALRGDPTPPFANYSDFPDRASVRAEWDRVEAMMRERLAELTDARLADYLDDDKDAMVWQMLLHVCLLYTSPSPRD